MRGTQCYTFEAFGHLEEVVLVFLSDGAGVPLLEQAERRYKVLVVLSLEMKEIPLKGLKPVDDKWWL